MTEFEDGVSKELVRMRRLMKDQTTLLEQILAALSATPQAAATAEPGESAEPSKAPTRSRRR